MRAVITVTGKDRTGIIAKISNTLYEHQVNIIDISQNVMEDVFAMIEANYSGTCVDALEYTKLYCDFVSDRSFNSFAFAELLVHIIKQDVKKFLRENFQKYFIKK